MRHRSIVILLALAACRPDDPVVIETNTPPSTPSILISPSSAMTDEDLVVVFTAEASDTDGDTVSYRYLWSVDGHVRTDLTSDTVSASETMKGQSWSVTVTPTDGTADGGPATAEAVIVNTPPSATVVVDPEAPEVTDEVVATAAGDDRDGDLVTFTFAWTVDGEATEFTDATLPAGVATRGETWTVTATPWDDEEAGAPVEASVMFDNSAPEVAAVTVTPAPATEGDTLVATVDGVTDEDADTVALAYAWYVDGALVQDGASPTLGAESFAKHQSVEVEVTPNDGFTNGDSVRSAPVSIEDSAPSIDEVTVDPATAYEASTLVCVPAGYADIDGDAAVYLYTWTVDGAVVAATETLDGVQFDKGASVACGVTPNDGEVDGATVWSEAVTVLNTAPSLSIATLSNRSPTESDTVSVTLTGAADDDGDAIAYTYNWYVNGALKATTSTLGSSFFAKGDTIQVEVTPWDGTDYGAPVWSDTGVATNSAPTATSVTLSPTTAYTGDLLTATTPTSDLDGDTVSVSYAWYVNGALVIATGATLDGSVHFDKGDQVYVVATPNDGVTDGTSVRSASLTIANTAPQLSRVTIDPAAAYESSTLTCLPSGYADADGDPALYAYVWTVNGSTVATTSTLGGSKFSKGAAVACSVTPNDGDVDGTTLWSTALTVGNSPPTLSGATLTNRAPTEADAVGITLGTAADDDGDSISFAYKWYVNGSLKATSSTLSGAQFKKGDTLQVEVLPWDGSDYGAPVWSDTGIVANSTPSTTAVSLSPTTAYTNDVLTASAATSDADGDTISVTYTWYVNGSAITATGSTLDGAVHFSKADRVYVVATASDGSASSAGLSSAAVTIRNTAPTTPVVAISPTDPQNTDDLVCDVVTPSTDADGDIVSYSYAWDVDGLDAGIASDTVPASDTTVGDAWTCTVAADDGDDVSADATDTVSIGGCYALDFDGSNDYVSLPTFSGLSNYTYELWVDADARGAPSAPDVLVATTCGQLVWDSSGFEINNYPSCNGASPAYANWAIPYTSWPSGWTHIALVVTSSTSAKIFVNGSRVATVTLTSDSPGSTQYGGIGGANTSFGASYFLDGRVAGVRISNTARYSASFTPDSTFTADSSTVALYAMNEGTGSSIADSSGNGRDGTVVGATWTEGECP